MDGKATLRLRKPEKDNPQHLYLENYELIHCDYSFHKAVNKRGEVCGDVLSGNIRVALPVLPTDELLSWALDSYKKLNGEITINDAFEESLERIYFEEGRCVGFRLHYEPGEESHHVVLLLNINAQRMILGEVEYKNT
jgi:hypothetical protein